MERDRLETESGDRERCESVDRRAGSDDRNLPASEPCERMCGSWRVGDGYAGSDAGPSAERAQTTAEAFLAAMEMSAAREVEPEPVGRRDLDQRGPTTDCEQRQAAKERGVGLRFGRSEV